MLDTTRADAVSAYGTVVGTTPTVDALASAGVLYENAYANANWTVPSHASLFTGLLARQHQLVAGGSLAPVPTVAELLQRAGYETVGMSENPWLAAKNGLDRGFETFHLSDGDLVGMVRNWARERKSDRPFFLFLNVMDAHEPYKIREANPFLPAGVTAAEARAVPQQPAHYVCAVKPGDRDATILRGLYLGDVQAADAKLGALLQALSGLAPPDRLITIATADHGQYLGEHWRVGHVIGVNEAVLRVPLIVHGLPGVSPARIHAPVQLVDVLPSLLAWVGVPAAGGLAGESLPTTEPATSRKTPIIAAYYDYFRLNQQMPNFLVSLKTSIDARCAPEQRMRGDMEAIVRPPYKLVWYSENPAQLFDLQSDPGEERDVLASRPQLAAELRAELGPGVAVSAGAAPRALAPADVERLRALGYFEHQVQ